MLTFVHRKYRLPVEAVSYKNQNMLMKDFIELVWWARSSEISRKLKSLGIIRADSV